MNKFLFQPGKAGRDNADSALDGMAVLIVDEDGAARAALRKCMQPWRLIVGEAATGYQCLDEAARVKTLGESYDVVILSRRLLPMDGVEFARRLKSDGSRPEVIMLIDHEETADLKQCASLGTIHTLTKPVDSESLHQLLIGIARSSGAVRSAPALSSPSVPLNEMKILAAEDDALNRKVIQQLLQRYGLQPDIVGNGSLAVTAAGRERYDLILMDVQMPGLDGLEATRIIREHETDGRVPIVALTASTMKGGRAQFLAAGMDDYLDKSFNRADIYRLLQYYSPGRKRNQRAGAVRQQDAGNDGAALLDSNDLKDRLGGDDSFVRELLQMFLHDCVEPLAVIETSLQAVEVQELERAAHKLKGMASNLSARALAHECAELEKAAERRELPLMNELASRTGAVASQTTEAMRRFLDEFPI